MKISEQGIELIKRHEGCVLKAYRCPAGVMTIGYGHTGDVRPGMVISANKALEYLRRDLNIAEACVNAAIVTPLTQNQFDALCSLVYNVGCGAFLRSTLLKKIKVNPSDEAIGDEFKRWVCSSGKTLPGLIKRRAAESELYFSRK